METLIQSFFVYTPEMVSQQEVELSVESTAKSILESLKHILSNPMKFAIFEAEIFHDRRLSHANTSQSTNTSTIQSNITTYEGICFRRMHDSEHPICVCYNWNVLNQTNTHCFVIKDFTLKSPYLDLRNELAGTLPTDAIRRRLERIQYKTDENKRLALARHREQIDTLVDLTRN
jgi:hypothetical protein